MWGGGCERGNLGEADPEPGKGRAKKERWPGGSENEYFLGCSDASDVIDGQ